MKRGSRLLIGLVEFSVVGGFVLAYHLSLDPINGANLARIRTGMQWRGVEQILGPPTDGIYRLRYDVPMTDAFGQPLLAVARTGHFWRGQTMTIEIDFCEDGRVVRTRVVSTRLTLVQSIQRFLRRKQPTAPNFLTPVSACAETLPD